MRRFLVFNRTKQTVLASEVDLADAGWARIKGLLGRSAKDLPAGKGLWIVPSQGIHTIGMSFPIDVVYLDWNCRVLLMYHRLPPFRLAALKFKARSVLELAPGTLSRSHTAVGDVLEIKELDKA